MVCRIKKGHTITVRVDELVAEGSAENADNDRANYYQISIKG